MSSSRFLYVYFNKQGVLTTQIPHGSGVIRQGDTFDLYICFDEDVDLSNKALYIKFKPPGESEWGTEYDITNCYLGGLTVFKKISPNEITYDLKDGKKYHIFKYKVTISSGITNKFGNLEALVTVLNQSTVPFSKIGPDSYQENDDVYANGLITIFLEKTYGKSTNSITRDQYIYLLSEIASLHNKMSADFLNRESAGISGDVNVTNVDGDLTVESNNYETSGNNKFILNKNGLKYTNNFNEDDTDYKVNILANEKNGFEVEVSKTRIGENGMPYIERRVLTLLPNGATINGVEIADKSYVQREAKSLADSAGQVAYNQAFALITQTNERLDKLLEGADIDFDTFKELSDQIKVFIEEHEEFIEDINALKTKLLTDNESTDINWTLMNNVDVTYSADNITSIVLNIPSTISHGFYCGFNFKSSNVPPAILINNNSNMDLEIVKNGRQVRNINPQPDTTARMFIDCDGMHVYITVQELIPDAIY